MFDKIIVQLQAIKQECGEVARKCWEMEARATPEQKAALEKKRTLFEAREHRADTCIDILSGVVFSVKNVDGDLVVVTPSPNTAALLTKAEELGARIVDFKKGDDEHAREGETAETQTRLSV